MNFGLTEEQQILRNVARRFLEERAPISTVRDVMESPEAFDDGLWKAMAELGWLGLTIDESHGGTGLGWVDLSVLLEEAGRGLLPVTADLDVTRRHRDQRVRERRPEAPLPPRPRRRQRDRDRRAAGRGRSPRPGGRRDDRHRGRLRVSPDRQEAVRPGRWCRHSLRSSVPSCGHRHQARRSFSPTHRASRRAATRRWTRQSASATSRSMAPS